MCPPPHGMEYQSWAGPGRAVPIWTGPALRWHALGTYGLLQVCVRVVRMPGRAWLGRQHAVIDALWLACVGWRGVVQVDSTRAEVSRLGEALREAKQRAEQAQVRHRDTEGWAQLLLHSTHPEWHDALLQRMHGGYVRCAALKLHALHGDACVKNKHAVQVVLTSVLTSV